MWEMAKSSISLFFQGKLFANPGEVFRQLLIGVIVAAVVLVSLVYFGLAVVTAAAIAGLVGGLLQPWLFKDLKYV